MQSVDLCRCHVTIFFFKSVKVTAEAHYTEIELNSSIPTARIRLRIS